MRTRQTFEALGLGCRVEVMDALYRASVEQVAQRIAEVDDEVASLLVVGHSPTIPALVAELTHADNPARADDVRCHYPTSTISVLQVEGSWADVSRLVETGEGAAARLADIRDGRTSTPVPSHTP